MDRGPGMGDENIDLEVLVRAWNQTFEHSRS